jgi:hypothetical protein
MVATVPLNRATAAVVAVSTATLACCAVVFLTGGSDLSDGSEGHCTPPERAGSRSATFRRVHVYERSGQFEVRLTAIAGVCGAPLVGASVSGTIEVT